jgi:hypothetical protein
MYKFGLNFIANKIRGINGIAILVVFLNRPKSDENNTSIIYIKADWVLTFPEELAQLEVTDGDAHDGGLVEGVEDGLGDGQGVGEVGEHLRLLAAAGPGSIPRLLLALLGIPATDNTASQRKVMGEA